MHMLYDIEIIMRDESGVGHGHVFQSWVSENAYRGEVYQNRLDGKLLTENAEYDELIDRIAEGKSFFVEDTTKLKAINEILAFYFITPLKKVPEIETQESFQTAIKHMDDNRLSFYLFHV